MICLSLYPKYLCLNQALEYFPSFVMVVVRYWKVKVSVAGK